MLADRTFDFALRDRTRFGPGSIASIPEVVREVAGQRAFLVTDPGVVASGVAQTVRDALVAGGVAVGLYDGVEPNPSIAAVERGAEALLSFGTSGVAVVGLGGGSAMDSAKAIALLAHNPGPLRDLPYDGDALVPGDPIVAIPTTAGTGAETNIYGVITDEAAGRKFYVGHRSLLPRATILDPVLTIGLPAAPTAATGIDALSHALESLLSRNPNPLAEALALGATRSIAEWLPRAVADGRDLEARSRLLLASHLAGLAMASGTGVGLVHAIGHSIGTRGRLPHGTAMAVVLADVLAFAVPVRSHELALAAVALGVASPADEPEHAAHAAVDAVRALIEAVGQRRTLRAVGLGAGDLPDIVRDALDDAAIRNTPRMPSADEVQAILEGVAG